MGSRLIPALLIGLLLVLHAQLWFGRGSVPQVASMKQQLAERNLINREAQQRNNSLAAEVRDLQEGLDMVEELARQELGMVKPNEIFVQIAQGKP
ncbi:MAG: septum formation initiator family protein [Hydrogenophaga sp.]|jgi:cell division protein FtsB|uniref:septum formation initiator family protein n=1 Tax=Hydrogenophaga sp. TaxID=1904254 RepID=UPI0027207F8B|nr:septum formation initiator family protein [Hydrogenophaga sp.]MDO9479006.1 septum formation initiator family protein [Hydrogenophaga sp.]MDO9570367.1 septum formation initiator family protein [Hydrogenophaga sp.]MDP2094057.1 septum formation initiator family protein [Hydrogenophaga sp.]MDP2221376.1 septum formation initiator family protein [Hydrogenophaga sp.]MDP3347046.1 septum formation initiator family protein [Hydrogenophaga sp.]